MKKTITLLLGLTFIGVAAFSLAACDESVTAYELAVKNGFVGTEEEWLRSLHGADGEDGADLDANALYEAAKANGYEGTFLEFCKTLNVSVPTVNDTVQISKNATSVVSIFCGYSKTTSSGGWFPSSTVEYGTQAGSGVIVDLNKQAGNAYIITNYHVVYNLKSDQRGILDDIRVYPYGAYNRFDPEYSGADEDEAEGGVKATYVGGAMDYDIAVLKVEGSEYFQNGVMTAAELGDSEKVAVGEETFVVGNPAGGGISVTNGILSVESEYITIEALDNRDLNEDGRVDGVSYRVMRTSAAINGGNSGGGMFNTAGKLIGIVNAKHASSTTDNMGYALPINQVKAVYDNILSNGNKGVRQATLGVIVVQTDSASYIDGDGHIRVKEEFCVSTVASRGSAAYQKLSVGDKFLAGRINDGEKVTFTRRYQLTELLLKVRLGDKVTLTILDSRGLEKEVTISFDKDAYFTGFD